jgi:TPR repeat protein
MSTPTDNLTGPLAYAPKWARDAAIAERRNAARQDRISKRNEFPDDAWPTEWPPAARSVDPIVLPPPPSRSSLLVGFAIAGGLAISASVGAITALFVVGKLPSWDLVPKDASLGAASFETRFIGQDDRTYGASLSAAANKQPRLAEPLRQTEEPRLAEPLRQTDRASSSAAANRQPRLAVPLRQTDGASPSAAANDEPRLAEPLRGATADHTSSTATDGASPSAVVNEEPRLTAPLWQTDGTSPSAANEQPRLAEPLRQTQDASPSVAANEEPRLAEPLRQTEGAGSSAAANEEPRLAVPLRQTDGASPSAAANDEPRLAEPLRQTDGASSSAAANDEPRLAGPLRGATVEHVTEPSPTPSALNADAIAAFLERAQELVSSGDIAAARVLLLRAAEARDPKAALALAATFDPIILQRTGAYGVVPDVPSARSWYEKAREFGSEEASRRLEMLARRQM